jgi:hypothetical protein
MSSLPISRPIYNSELSRPIRDPKFRAWIRTLPCVVCGRVYGVECAHTGDHGMGQKASDRRGIPLCRRCHDEYGCIGRRNFETLHELDIEALILRLNQKPVIKVFGDRYVALIGEDEYDMGSARTPLSSVVKLSLVIARSRVPF